jgi:hypothetical protein
MWNTFARGSIDKANLKSDELVTLFESLLELHKKSLPPSAEREKIEREIASTDEKIDYIVYELYGITEEERRIIGAKWLCGNLRYNQQRSKWKRLQNDVWRKENIKMKGHLDDRWRLLDALLEYVSKSPTFINPHFFRKEMMDHLGVTEGQFTIMQKRLGDEYCHFVDQCGDDNRYAINVSKCLALREQYDQQQIQERRHRQLVRLTVLTAVLTAVLATALTLWFIPK